MSHQVFLSAHARALRYVSAFCFLVTIFTMTFVACMQDHKRRMQNLRETPSLVDEAFLEARQRPSTPKASSSRPERISQEALIRQTTEVDVETTNLTIILENLQVEGDDNPDAPWMYSEGALPFVEDQNVAGTMRAFTKLSWNSNGSGDGSCGSGGSGKVTRGYLDPFNYHVKLSERTDFERTKVELLNLSLSDFEHINTLDGDADWTVMGKAGDSRRYSYGTFRVWNDERVLIDANNVQWLQNVSYPQPIGEAPPDSMYVGGYFTGELNEFGSDDEWVRQLDPHGMGYILGIITAASFGPPLCVTSNSYWITLRGFPNLKRATITEPYVPSLFNDSRRSGAKSGVYQGSNGSEIETAQTLANLSRNVVTTAVSAVVVSAAGSAAAAVVAPAAVTAPPGQGMFRLVTNTAFVAKINEVYGFHSDAMAEFGEGLKPFIGKLEFPFSSETLAESRFGRWFLKRVDFRQKSGLEDTSTVRQEVADDVTVSDELFGGCAFYTSIVVLGFLCLHVIIWLSTRRKPIKQQLAPHAWMVYIFSIVMSYVFTASVLNSTQYLRSHLGGGTGRIGLYIIAVLQLLFIGVGFTAFFLTIVFLALRRVRNQKVKWVPRKHIPSPKVRNRVILAGEYQVTDNNIFHTLFECYYSSLAGPRLWLAGIELTIVFLDAICTATIWNEVICLAVLICVYAILFLLFLVFAPFVDKIEGRLVTTLGLVDLVLLIVEFLGALGDYETAEQMERIALILGFVSIGLAVLTAVYCDLIPMAISCWRFLRKKYRRFFLGMKEVDMESDSDSQWSFLSHTVSEDVSVAEEEVEDDELVVRDQTEVKGLITQVFRDIGPRPKDKGVATAEDSSDGRSLFDWKSGTRGRNIDWARGGSPSDGPHSNFLHIANSQDSNDTIEWPKVGQIIYSVRDLGNATHEGSEEDVEEMEPTVIEDSEMVQGLRGQNQNGEGRQ